MGFTHGETIDKTSESSLQHETNSSWTSEAGHLPTDPHDMKHLDSVVSDSNVIISESISNFIGSTPQPHQEAIMNKGRELMHVVFMHTFRHTPISRGELTGTIERPHHHVRIEVDACHVWTCMHHIQTPHDTYL
jgi:hypothetical protein